MTLVERLSKAMQRLKPEAKRMFSGTGFLLNGNLVIGTRKGGLIVRVGAADEDRASRLPGASVMEMRGRKMPGWIIVAAEGCKSDAQIAAWIDMALAFNKTLPAKTAKPAAKKSKKK